MKHFIIVSSIILFVLLTFFTPTLIEDASFSRYDYLHDFRRTSHARDDDHPNDGWQKDGTFNPIHIIQETRPDGTKRIIDNDSEYYYRNSVDNEKVERVDRVNRINNERVNRENNGKNVEKKSDKSDKSDSETNLLPYLLIILVLLFIVIVAVKYTGSNKNLMNIGNATKTA